MENFYFSDKKHKENTINLIKDFRRYYADNSVDTEYLAAYYILSIDESLRTKCYQYINDGGIDFPTMKKKQGFSSGQKILVDLAHALFRSEGKVDIGTLICSTGVDYFEVAMQAIRFRRSIVAFNEEMDGIK